MLTFSDIQRNHHQKGLVTAWSLLLLVSSVPAQSGRRTPKPPTITPPQTEQPQVAGAISGRRLTEKVSLIVARQPTSKHLLSEDAITASVIRRLNELPNVNATAAGDLNHDKAVKRARSEKQRPVVLLEFDVDTFQSGTIFLNSPDLDVRVLIFAPESGQQKFKGNVYYKAVGGPMLKKDNWPSGPPVRITTDAVGIEAAEQVYDWLVVQEMKRKE